MWMFLHARKFSFLPGRWRRHDGDGTIVSAFRGGLSKTEAYVTCDHSVSNDVITLDSSRLAWMHQAYFTAQVPGLRGRRRPSLQTSLATSRSEHLHFLQAVDVGQEPIPQQLEVLTHCMLQQTFCGQHQLASKVADCKSWPGALHMRQPSYALNDGLRLLKH